MHEDALKWNERYKNDFMPNEPSAFVINACALLEAHFPQLKVIKDTDNPRPVALDIACGNGRHAKVLSQLGFMVDALDISSIALKNLANIAHITPVLADLDNFIFTPNRYDVVLNSFFLDRRLFPSLIASLKPNGIVLFETFIRLDVDSHLDKAEKALYVNELESIFSPQNGFTTLHHHIYENIESSTGKRAAYPHIVQFIAQYTGNHNDI